MPKLLLQGCQVNHLFVSVCVLVCEAYCARNACTLARGREKCRKWDAGRRQGDKEGDWWLHCDCIFTSQWLHVSKIFGEHVVFLCHWRCWESMEEKALNRWPQTDGSVLLNWEKRAGGWTVKRRGRREETEMDETRATGVMLSDWCISFWLRAAAVKCDHCIRWAAYASFFKNLHFFYNSTLFLRETLLVAF